MDKEMTIKWAPSILAADFKELGKQVKESLCAGAQYLHIDVMDGSFVPQISFGEPVIRSIRNASDQFFDVHLMVIHPEDHIQSMAECGADSITFHLEAAEHPESVIGKIRSCGKRVGLALKPGTHISEVKPYLDQVDMILLMTVEPGFGGQKMLGESFDRVAQLREMIGESGYPVDLEVDGGINCGNVAKIIKAGANIIVAGSALFGGDISRNISDFAETCNQSE